MPIYVYHCASCDLEQEFLQKLSDPPLTVCPACKNATLSKMLTAAGFHLKGTGWYVTDFKGGSKPGTDAKPAEDASPKTEKKAEESKPASDTKLSS